MEFARGGYEDVEVGGYGTSLEKSIPPSEADPLFGEGVAVGQAPAQRPHGSSSRRKEDAVRRNDGRRVHFGRAAASSSDLDEGSGGGVDSIFTSSSPASPASISSSAAALSNALSARVIGGVR